MNEQYPTAICVALNYLEDIIRVFVVCNKLTIISEVSRKAINE